MKYFLVLLSVLSVFSANASGTVSSDAIEYTSCQNGDISKVGDSWFGVDLLEDGIRFFQYEADFSFDFTDIVSTENTYHIVNKTTAVSVEGEEESSVVNALLIYDKSTNKLNMAISRDQGAFESHQMDCVLKKAE